MDIKQYLERNGTRKRLLQAGEVCEYALTCKQECNGKKVDRENTFSCGLRRGLLISDGFRVEW